MSDKVVVDKQGHTLRGDAAGSYLRMLAAGMPAGGVDVFQRTMDEQKALYARYQKYGSPIAARPSLTAPHIKNVAMDFQTTRDGKYNPSAAFRWITNGTDGSKAPRDTNDAKMRGHEYGWYRSVPSERWHLQYDPKKDKHAAADLAAKLKALGYKDVKAFQKAHKLTDDGIAGPLTWAGLLVNPKPVETKPEVPVPDPIPVPEPQPVPSKDHKVKVMTVNAQAKRFGGGVYVDDGKFVDSLDPAVALGCEVEEIARDQIIKYSDLDKVYPVNYVALFFKNKEFTYGPSIPITFDDKGVQGAVAAELTSKVNGGKFVACSVHIRPNDAIRGTAAQKLKGKTDDIREVVKTLAKYPNVVVGGDWSTESARQILKDAGYRQATPDVDTYKNNKLDSIWVKGNIKVEGTGKVVKTDSSDHASAIVDVIIPAPKA